MKAAFIEQTGPPDVIRWGELPTPEPGPGQVLVRVEAVSVNPIDTYLRAGMVPVALPKPFVPGCDLAGVVERVGPGVGRFKPGDRVWGSNQGLLGRQGTFAEYAAVDEQWLYPIPEGVAARDAAAGALVGITAHLALVRHGGGVGPDSRVVISGGSGAVGSSAIQMARAMGARVAATAGTEDKCRLCRALGAEVAVLYHQPEEVEAAIRRFAPDGVTLWVETSREPAFDRIVPLMALGGRIVILAGRDARPPFPVGPFYTRDLSLHGFAMFNAPPDVQRTCAEAINGWLASGAFRPVIGRVMKLSEAAEAHRLQEDNTLRRAGTLTGKIVLEP